MPRRMRLLTVTLLVGMPITLTACGNTSSGPSPTEPASNSIGTTDTTNLPKAAPVDLPELSARSVEAGGVEITFQPDSVSDTGAVFTISFDTHSVELSMNPATIARLEVGGIEWPADSWEGDPAGGHHRKGTLSFSSAGPVEGEITIELHGFPAPATATWQLED